VLLAVPGADWTPHVMDRNLLGSHNSLEKQQKGDA